MAITANAQGILSCKFNIPAGIPSGKKRVTVLGNHGSFGETFFEGRGELWEEHRHTTTTVKTTTNYMTTRYYQSYYYGWYYYPYNWYYHPYYGYYWGWYPCGWYDPLAQTFRVDKSQQIAGVELFVREKGETPITVQLRTTQNGVPTDNLLATVSLDPSLVTVSAWNRWVFHEPVRAEEGEEYCIVVLCDDADAELAIAELGKWDNTAQKWITTQPYTIGTLLSSSNASTWTPHQDKDLAFRLLGANYTETTKEITLGTVTLTDATDIALAGDHFIPSSESQVAFSARLPNGETIAVTPGVGRQLATPVTGDVTLKAVLKGTATETPIVAPGAQLVHGKLKETATYVSRAIEAGPGSKIVLVLDAAVPTGASLKAEWKGIDPGDTWTEFAVPTSKPLSNEWAELVYTATGVDEDMVQVRLTLTGNSAARPLASNLRLYTA